MCLDQEVVDLERCERWFTAPLLNRGKSGHWQVALSFFEAMTVAWCCLGRFSRRRWKTLEMLKRPLIGTSDVRTSVDVVIVTLPETNIANENGWLEYYFPFGEAYFQGLC